MLCLKINIINPSPEFGYSAIPLNLSPSLKIFKQRIIRSKNIVYAKIRVKRLKFGSKATQPTPGCCTESERHTSTNGWSLGADEQTGWLTNYDEPPLSKCHKDESYNDKSIERPNCYSDLVQINQILDVKKKRVNIHVLTARLALASPLDANENVFRRVYITLHHSDLPSLIK